MRHRLVRALSASVLSLLLLAASVAVSRQGLAVHDTSLFELDGNATAQSFDDWNSLFPVDTSPNEIAKVFVAEPPAADTTYFTGGGSKDVNDITQWRWAGVPRAPDKDEVTNAYAVAYLDADGKLVIYFGLDRFSNAGSADVGFWFLQNPVSLSADGTFAGTHAVGDILVVAEFTQGGKVAAVNVWHWTASGLQLLTTGQECSGGLAGDAVCAIVNSSPQTAPWPYVPKQNVGSPGTFPTGTFFEGGINLGHPSINFSGCFTTFLAETRSSFSKDAQLKDFALGSFDTCASLTIVKDADPDDPQDFAFTTQGAGLENFSLDDDPIDQTLPNSRTFTGLVPGTYKVTEAAPAGWDLTALTCDGGSFSVNGTTVTVTLGFNANVTCTFTNTKRGSITIVKDADPDDPQDFDFTTTSGTDTPLPASFLLDDDGDPTLSNTVVFSNLKPGTYTVTEVLPSGWDLTDLSCTGGTTLVAGATATVTLGAGESITCTFTNTKQPEPVFGKTPGFWRSRNGIAILDPDGDGSLGGNAVFLGGVARGILVDTVALSNKILSNDACAAGTPTVFDCTATGGGLSLDLNLNTLEVLAAHTLALTYNVNQLAGYSGQTVGSLGCSVPAALLPFGLTNSSTVEAVLTVAHQLIDSSTAGGTLTQAQASAMVSLLSCLNTEP